MIGHKDAEDKLSLFLKDSRLVTFAITDTTDQLFSQLKPLEKANYYAALEMRNVIDIIRKRMLSIHRQLLSLMSKSTKFTNYFQTKCREWNHLFQDLDYYNIALLTQIRTLESQLSENISEHRRQQKQLLEQINQLAYQKSILFNDNCQLNERIKTIQLDKSYQSYHSAQLVLQKNKRVNQFPPFKRLPLQRSQIVNRPDNQLPHFSQQSSIPKIQSSFGHFSSSSEQLANCLLQKRNFLTRRKIKFI